MKLRVSNLTIEYVTEGYSVRAVDDLSFEADAGELVVLLGPSGSGKTSVLSCLAGILTPSAGSIEVDGVTVNALSSSELAQYRRSKVGIVFQASNLIQSLTARENVAAPLLIAHISHSKAMARADELLAQVDLAHRTSHKPGRLSGGQQTRVALARGLAHDPPVLLADEPTANLDYVNAEAVITLLRDLRAAGRLIIVSTHDDRMVRIADRVINMVKDFHPADSKPQIVKYKKGETIFEQGSRGELVYSIESGTVEIVRQTSEGSKPLAQLEKGQYFGELGPLLGFPRSATAIAKTNATLTSYGVRHFRERFGASGTEPAKKAPARKTKAEPAKKTARTSSAKKTPAKRAAAVKPKRKTATAKRTVVVKPKRKTATAKRSRSKAR